MNWNNLKNNKCPKCNQYLTMLLSCSDSKCEFSISKEKFEKIVNDLYGRKTRKCITFEANLEALNNLDRPLVSEDFSDTPPLLTNT